MSFSEFGPMYKKRKKACGVGGEITDPDGSNTENTDWDSESKEITRGV